MDHQYIDGHNIPDRYLQGTLSPTDRMSFEEHFVDCPECLDRLEMTDHLRASLRAVAAEDGATRRTPAWPGLRAWLGALAGGWQPAVLAAAVLLLVAVPPALLVPEIGRARRQADQANRSTADWQRRYEDSQQAARTAEQALQAKEQQLSRLQLETGTEREREASVVEEAGRQARLQLAAPIFDLNTVRGGTPGQSAARLSIPRSARWIVLKLEIEPDPALQSYRATLLTSNQQAICRASDAIAVNEALALSCDASLFTPGDYRLTLEGLTRQGQYVPAGTYAFHVAEP